VLEEHLDELDVNLAHHGIGLMLDASATKNPHLSVGYLSDEAMLGYASFLERVDSAETIGEDDVAKLLVPYVRHALSWDINWDGPTFSGHEPREMEYETLLDMPVVKKYLGHEKILPKVGEALESALYSPDHWEGTREAFVDGVLTRVPDSSRAIQAMLNEVTRKQREEIESQEEVFLRRVKEEGIDLSKYR